MWDDDDDDDDDDDIDDTTITSGTGTIHVVTHAKPYFF